MSLAHSVSDQIFTSTLHWMKATQFPETATHAIDFGPGGLSVIGPFTSCNLDGCGVRILDKCLPSSVKTRSDAF